VRSEGILALRGSGSTHASFYSHAGHATRYLT
jgi:hypothetical protein